MHHHPASLWVAAQPVVLRPDIDVLEPLKVAFFVFLVAFVAPEEARHAWVGFPNDHLARFSGMHDTFTARGIRYVDVHPKP